MKNSNGNLRHSSPSRPIAWLETAPRMQRDGVPLSCGRGVPKVTLAKQLGVCVWGAERLSAISRSAGGLTGFRQYDHGLELSTDTVDNVYAFEARLKTQWLCVNDVLTCPRTWLVRPCLGASITPISTLVNRHKTHRPTGRSATEPSESFGKLH